MLVDPSWVEARLDKFRDKEIDIGALCDYVMVLLKRDEELSVLKLTMKEELRDFLAEECNAFVDDLFREIHRKHSTPNHDGSSIPRVAIGTSKNKRVRDFSGESDEKPTWKERKVSGDSGVGAPASGVLDYSTSLQVLRMPFDHATMASMMNQMMHAPPLSYEAAYSYESRRTNIESGSGSNQVDEEATSIIKEAEKVDTTKEERQDPEHTDEQPQEVRDGNEANLEESMRGHMEVRGRHEGLGFDGWGGGGVKGLGFGFRNFRVKSSGFRV